MDFSKEYLVKLLEDKIPAVYPVLNLIEKKREMDKLKGTGIKGGDNYYHRLAMCENAQKGDFQAAISRIAGFAKEGKDLFCKTYGLCGERRRSYTENLRDSLKDLRNNEEGINLGLQNPEKDCKILLQDLDWETNTWKKPRK